MTTKGSEMASDDDVQRILEARGAFASAYCRAKGWSEDPDELTWEQIFEIRAQDGWKRPGPLHLLITPAPKPER
jgi:hypothetical protein